MSEADEVREFWQALGLPGLIDVHAHFMPERVLDKVWAYFDSVGPLTGRPWPIAYRQTEQQRIDTLRAFGVRAFTAMLYPHKPGMAEWLNSWATDFAFGSDFPNIPYGYPEALRALADLDLGDDWLRAVCHDNAARLFGLGRGTLGACADRSKRSVPR